MKFEGNYGSLVNCSLTRDETCVGLLLGRYCTRHEYDQQKEDGCCVATSTAAAQPLSFFCFLYLFVRFSWLFALFNG